MIIQYNNYYTSNLENVYDGVQKRKQQGGGISNLDILDTPKVER